MDISINLIRRCKQKEREAFDILLSSYEEQLYRLCFHYTRNHENSMDIMQEVFIRVFRAIDSFDESRPFWPWLKRIAVNSCLNYKIDQEKHLYTALEDLDLDKPNLINVIDSRHSLEEEIILRDTGRIIEESILALPEPYRMAITLRYLENMSYQEIASYLDQPLGTVKSTLCRARNILRQQCKSLGLLEV